MFAGMQLIYILSRDACNEAIKIFYSVLLAVNYVQMILEWVCHIKIDIRNRARFLRFFLRARAKGHVYVESKESLHVETASTS